MKIYLSSTFEDLREHRAALEVALRRMGHDVIGMEHYVAESATPLQRCLADVRASDVYAVIVAWRYGYVPTDPEANPRLRSITELEYEEALASRRSILAFLLDPTMPWPPNSMDSASPHGGAEVLRFRALLGGRHLAGMFRGPDSLAGLGAPAIAVQGMNDKIAERVLLQNAIGEDFFLAGEDLVSTAIDPIKDMVRNVGATRAMVIDLGVGRSWWSTRLYLLATLLQTLSSVRQLVFTHPDGRFAGMASPAAVREGLCAAFPAIATFDTAWRSADGASDDTDREIDRTVQLWIQQIGKTEAQLKVGVRWTLLGRWLGERLVTRCIQLDADAGLTTVQAQRIIESLIPDVPIEKKVPPSATDKTAKVRPTTTDKPATPRQWQLIVVDRDAFALEVAREWVRTGLPRER